MDPKNLWQKWEAPRGTSQRHTNRSTWPILHQLAAAAAAFGRPSVHVTSQESDNLVNKGFMVALRHVMGADRLAGKRMRWRPPLPSEASSTTTTTTPSRRRDVTRLLMLFFVFIAFLTAVIRFQSLSFTTTHQAWGRGADLDLLDRALSTLEGLGILTESLCHPTIDGYHSRIPRCSGGKASRDDSRSDDAPTTIRRLAQEDLPTSASPSPGLAWFLAWNIIASTACIAFVALASCMFLGFMTLDSLALQIKIRASVDSEERMHAQRLLPIVQDHHRLLVTLLLTDALAYESLPLFLDNLMPSWAAVVLSVSFLLVFGEILPSAVITGPEQLRLASQLTPLVNFFLWALWPIATPLTWLLDKLVPHDDDAKDGEAYNRGELSALVRIQYEERQARANRRATAGPHMGKLRSNSLVAHQLQQQQAEEQQEEERKAKYHSRGWRALKREIMEAVEQRHYEQQQQQQHQTTAHSSGTSHHYHHYNSSGGGSNQNNNNATSNNRRGRSTSVGSEHDSVHSHSTPPAYEQIAPPLHHAEIRVVEGALTMKTKCAWDVYTPLRMIFAVPYDLELDRGTIAEIYSEGYSRVPVFERLPPPNEHRKYAIRGVLMTRHLIMIDWADQRPVSSLPLYTPPCVSPRMNLVNLLQLLQQGGSHIAFVCAGPDLATKALDEDRAIPIEAGFMGLVTLEDVLEAILQDRIYDEEDVSDRDLASATLTQWAAKILQRFYRKRRMAKQQSRRGITGGSGDLDVETGPSADDIRNFSFMSAQRFPGREDPVDHEAAPTASAAVAMIHKAASDNMRQVEHPPFGRAPPIPEEIDLETGRRNNSASERTPLLFPS